VDGDVQVAYFLEILIRTERKYLYRHMVLQAQSTHILLPTVYNQVIAYLTYEAGRSLIWYIRLDALAFKPSKSQRKIINRWVMSKVGDVMVKFVLLVT